MKDRTFLCLLIVTAALCAVLTLAHLAYGMYAFGHCSVIRFIAGETWG